MSIRYHYCSYETFKAIISNKTLRLSDIRKSNDKYEMILLLKEHRGIGNLSKYVNYKDDGFWENLESYMTEITNNTECFASCLSIGSDKLSQWERYADKCKGLAIGFNEKKLQSYILKIANEISEFNQSINEFNYINLIAKKITYKKLLTTISYPSDFADNFSKGNAYFEDCAFTKHYGFREEKEFRIALIFSKTNTEFVNNKFKEYFINNGCDFFGREFLDLKFPKDIIEEIYSGPLNEISDKEVSDHLKKNEIFCRVKKSMIPYSPNR